MPIQYSYRIICKNKVHFQRIERNLMVNEKLNLNDIIKSPQTFILPNYDSKTTKLFIAFHLQQFGLRERKKMVKTLLTKIQPKMTDFKFQQYKELLGEYVAKEFEIPQKWFDETDPYIGHHALSQKINDKHSPYSKSREKLAETYYINLEKYGVLNLHDWKIKWWGTEQDEFDVIMNSDNYSFEFTAERIHQSLFNTMAHISHSEFILIRTKDSKTTTFEFPQV